MMDMAALGEDEFAPIARRYSCTPLVEVFGKNARGIRTLVLSVSRMFASCVDLLPMVFW